MLTSEVENFPGFPEGIMGPDLMANMRQQATRFGATFIDKNVTAVDFSQAPHQVVVDDLTYTAPAVIIATGAATKWLELESEKRLRGKGVSSCATCDGFFFRGKDIAVIGGGDSALEEATFLTRFANKVTIVHRRDQLSASKAMQDKAFADPKIEVVWNKQVQEVLGQDKVEGLKLLDSDGTTTILPVQGIFVAIGHRPSTEVFRNQAQLELDPIGYLQTTDQTKTAIPGIFAAGDVFDSRYRQAITAAASGCKAALDAQHYLESL